MKAMTYRGYAARIEYSEEDECFVGHVAGIKDIISFHGESVTEIRAAFHEAVDFYLTTCTERGEEPNKPYSGKVLLRIDPALHAQIAMHAQALGKSINQYASEVLANG